MDKIIIYHGSSEIVKQPVYGKGKPYNDYGIGFYCTEHLELAKEWACTKNIDGFVNEYELDLTHLKVLHLSEYSILHWLALLMVNRRFRISTPVMRRGFQWLKDNFLIDITGYDVIIGYRADDSYFSFARAFINNDRYLDRGIMYVLEDDGIKSECVVTDEGDGILEIKNIATDPEHQGHGYGKALITFLEKTYSTQYSILQVGTGDVPSTVLFYEACGFHRSHRIKNFFIDHYDHPIYEDGMQLMDMVYLQKNLSV